jgi:hypothetical protein
VVLSKFYDGGDMLQDILRFCAVCGKPYVNGRLYTCSEGCHHKLVDELVEEFGESKKVVDAEGTAHQVPTREILERGLKYEDLKKYPKWEEESPVHMTPNRQVLKTTVIEYERDG